MHIKKRGKKALLYRSVWVSKGAEGNSHGFSRQVYVASLQQSSTELPSEIAVMLTPAERAFVELRVLTPAKEEMARRAANDEKRSRDPLWRLDEALRLSREASALSAQARVPAERVRELQKSLAAVHVVGVLERPVERDPLESALEALCKAARAVAEGHYGTAPEGHARKSGVYSRWLEIVAQVDGGASDGLLRELQARAWVKAKSR